MEQETLKKYAKVGFWLITIVFFILQIISYTRGYSQQTITLIFGIMLASITIIATIGERIKITVDLVIFSSLIVIISIFHMLLILLQQPPAVVPEGYLQLRVSIAIMFLIGNIAPSFILGIFLVVKTFSNIQYAKTEDVVIQRQTMIHKSDGTLVYVILGVVLAILLLMLLP